MKKQSTNHIFMIEPVGFYSNPETIATNPYQSQMDESLEDVQQKAVAEHQQLQQLLKDHGIKVTVVKGAKQCPDDVFPNNWISAHVEGRVVTYPMLAPNRRLERRRDIIEQIKKTHPNHIDFSASEENEVFLEGTGSLVLDRVNQIAYAALSPRTHKNVVDEWADKMGYKVIAFDTTGLNNQPIYHTNVMMFIASDVALVCLEDVPAAQREEIEATLKQTHEVIAISNDQVNQYCGNGLEVRNDAGDVFLVMSSSAYNGLGETLRQKLTKHFTKILHTDLSTIEKYGGGSARCMMLEIF